MSTRYCLWCHRDKGSMSSDGCDCGVVAREIDMNAPRGTIDPDDRAYETARDGRAELQQQLDDMARSDR